MDIRFIALDNKAMQAIEACGNTISQRAFRADISNIPVIAQKDTISVMVSSALTQDLVNKVVGLSARSEYSMLVYPGGGEADEYSARLLTTGIVPVAVRRDSLVTISVSQTLEMIEDIFGHGNDDDIIFTEEEPRKLIERGKYGFFVKEESRNIRDSALYLVRKHWELQSASAVALSLHLYPGTPLTVIDEVLDLIESRMEPSAKFYAECKFDLAEGERPSIVCMMSRYLPKGTSFQDEIDKAGSYLSKAAKIVDLYAREALSSAQANALATDNGIDPDDLQTLYMVAYRYNLEIVDLMRKLRNSSSNEERVELVAQALKDEFIEPSILEELVFIYGLSVESVLRRAEAG